MYRRSRLREENRHEAVVNEAEGRKLEFFINCRIASLAELNFIPASPRYLLARNCDTWMMPNTIVVHFAPIADTNLIQSRESRTVFSMRRRFAQISLKKIRHKVLQRFIHSWIIVQLQMEVPHHRGSSPIARRRQRKAVHCGNSKNKWPHCVRITLISSCGSTFWRRSPRQAAPRIAVTTCTNKTSIWR